MPITTATQFAIVVLVFVAGWLLGLASHPGGRKWRDRYTAERDAHAAYRKEADARVAAEREALAAHRKETDSRIAEADRRTAEAEREHARLAKAAPFTASTVSPARTAAARPAYPAGERRGWFDWR